MGDSKLLDASEANKLVKALVDNYSDAHYYLDFKTPIDLVVAAILSAQTRDVVTNKTTPALFSKYKTAKDYANVGEKELLEKIRGVTFPENKAKNIIKTCKIIAEKYNGKVPNSMDQLLDLPGIGRKTANTILINAYGIVEGIPVDTWVIKLSPRLGLSFEKNPDKIEQDLKGKLEKKYWGKITYVLKTHGRELCKPVPICSKCPVQRLCPKNGVTARL
jgi:endonuclease III